jgi:hypothetical protein
MAGTVLDIGGIPVSVLGTVNASEGGLGPNEDLEGNSPVGRKGKLMADLGMLTLPTIVVEGKVYTPKFCSGLKAGPFWSGPTTKPTIPMWPRPSPGQRRNWGYPVMVLRDVMARVPGAMKAQTIQLAERVIALGNPAEGSGLCPGKGGSPGGTGLPGQPGRRRHQFHVQLLKRYSGRGGNAAREPAPSSATWCPPPFTGEYLSLSDGEGRGGFRALTKQSLLEIKAVLPKPSPTWRSINMPGI